MKKALLLVSFKQEEENKHIGISERSLSLQCEVSGGKPNGKDSRKLLQ